MALTAEEVEKLKELKRTEEFKKNYKLIKDELVKRDRQGVDMAAKGLICLFVMCYLPRRAGFPLAGILLFVLIIIPFFKSKSDIDLDDIYTEQILNLILGAILPKAKIHSWGEEPIEDVKYAVPKSEKYNQFNALKFNDERNLSVCNFYAWHEEEYKSGKEKRTKEVTDFRGVLYALTLREVYQGHVRIVPTKKLAHLNIETQGKYAGALEGEQKIDVEDVRHNENYNIYCTDEIAARKFLSPSVLAWFDEQISDQGLCAYLKGNKLYISKFTNEYMFPVPDTKKKLNAWSVEKAALYLKDLSQEAKAMASVFSK